MLSLYKGEIVVKRDIRTVEKEARKIRNRLWGALGFFILGLLVVYVIKENWPPQNTQEVFGTYLLVGAWSAGIYMSISLGTKIANSYSNAFSGLQEKGHLCLMMIAFAPIAFIPLVIRDFYRLSKLHDEEREMIRTGTANQRK